MRHHVPKQAPADIIEHLREDALLGEIYRAQTPGALRASMAGWNAGKRQQTLEAIVVLCWYLLRRL